MLKKCTQCGVIAHTEEELHLFAISKTCIYNRRNVCKKCRTLQNKKYPKREKDYYRNNSYKSLYGITIDDYKDMLVKQGYRCMICGTHQDNLKKRLYVDHCHNSNQVRGLLCQSCNTLIGFSYDDIDILSNAIEYINKYKD